MAAATSAGSVISYWLSAISDRTRPVSGRANRDILAQTEVIGLRTVRHRGAESLHPPSSPLPALQAHALLDTSRGNNKDLRPKNRIRSGHFLSLPALQSCIGGKQVRGGDESRLSKVRPANVGAATGSCKYGLGGVRQRDSAQ